MRKSKFGEAKIAGILKEAESGVSVADISHKHGVISATFYKWRATIGGMATSGMARLRELERENARLSGCTLT